MWEELQGLELNTKVAAALVVLLISILLAFITRPSLLHSRRTALRACERDIRRLLQEKHCHPLLLRLAFHDAGTYDRSIGVKDWPTCMGANGSIRFVHELVRPENAGLNKAIDILKAIKKRHREVSWADLIQMAGALAVEEAGGPNVNSLMRYGRVDAPDNAIAAEGNLPSAVGPFPDGAPDASTHIRNVFYRLGFNNSEIVALCGAHTLGRAFKDRSGVVDYASGASNATKYTAPDVAKLANGQLANYMPGGSSWTERWLVFDNSYFTRTTAKVKDPQLTWLPTDSALMQDPEFRVAFEKYRRDEKAFFHDYALAHRKMSELGAKFNPPEGITLI